MDLIELHELTLASFGSIISHVEQSQWKDATPCSEWNVYDLMNHVVSENLWVPPMLAGKTIADVGDEFEGHVIQHDPIGAYEQSRKLCEEAAQQPGVLDTPVKVSYGPVPGRVYLGHRIVDLVIHGWDLAKTTKQSTTIRPTIVDDVWEIINPELSDLQGSGYFGIAQKVSDSADSQTRLLAALGRQA